MRTFKKLNIFYRDTEICVCLRLDSGAAVGTCTTNRTGAGPVPTAEPTQYTPDTRTQPRPRQPRRTARLGLTSSASSINSIALQTQTRHQNQEAECTGQRRRISEQRSGWRGSPGEPGGSGLSHHRVCCQARGSFIFTTKGFLASATPLMTTASLVNYDRFPGSSEAGAESLCFGRGSTKLIKVRRDVIS